MSTDDPRDEPERRALIKTTTLASGYGVRTEERPGGDVLEIVAPGGQVCLQIVLAPEGLKVQIDSAALEVRAKGTIAVECETLAVRARESIALTAGKDVAIDAGGMIETEAWGQEIRARRGDVHLEANDDVLLDGERVRLNSPRTPKELEAMARARARGDSHEADQRHGARGRALSQRVEGGPDPRVAPGEDAAPDRVRRDADPDDGGRAPGGHSP
jgi:hypothetical protein